MDLVQLSGGLLVKHPAVLCYHMYESQTYSVHTQVFIQTAIYHPKIDLCTLV